jgi:putative ABC transport system permease protein
MSAFQASVRLFATRPGLAASIVLTLAIGLGSVTAISSITHALLLKPLPFPDADRVVAIHAEVADERGRLALRELRELERSATAFAKVGAYYRTQYNLTGDGPPQALTCTMPTSTMFDVLGVRALHGEVWPQALDFTRHYTVLLSHGLWQQRFGGRPDVVGQSMVMDGTSYSIAGVLPDAVDFPLQTDVYRGVTDYNAQDVRRYSVIARMAAGRTLGDARAELDALSARFASFWPDTNLGVQLRAVPLRDAYVGGARPFVLLMAAGVGLLMLMAAVNVTNLLLSRALSQEGDFAVRLALGASRWHLVRQGVVEVLGVTAVGAVLGAAGARIAVDRITGLVGADLPPWMKVEVNLPALAISAVAAAIAAVAIAILPALQASRTDVERVLRQHAGRSGSGGRHRPRQWLVGAQAAIASLLLVTAGLFAAGLTHLMGLTPGFDARGALTFRTDPPFSRYGDIATTSEFYRRAAEALRTIPGVTAVGANTNLPFARLDVASPRVSVEGRDSGRSDESPFVNLQLIDPGYFDAMRIPLVRGRRFEPTDDESAPMAAIVSERTARRFWGAEEAIGRRLRLNWNQDGVGSGGGSELWLTVVGVVGSVRFDGVEDVSGLDVYAPHTQMFAGDSFFVVRTAADPAAIGRQVRAALDTVDRDQSFFDVVTLEARMGRTLWQHRVATLVLTLFAAIALILAVLGTYAVTAHAVAAQRREIGIRRALGSSASRLGWLVARQWAGPVATGVIVGLGAGLLAARALTTAIGVPATGIGWLVLLPAALAGAAGIACVVPVARLLRQVPLTDALRTE